ncbi:MAG: PIN domain-containing protein [Bacteroidota bacterium]
MKIFVDTWAWVALADKRDPHHKDALNSYRNSVLFPYNDLITSQYVLSESLTLLRPRIGHQRTLEWLDVLYESERRGTLQIIRSSNDIWNESLTLLRRTKDKPDISHTDFTSFVIMTRLDVKEVFSGDKHFEQINMGFHIIK